jgi:hypothetical protein
MGPQAATKITSEMTLSERADHLEEHMMHELDSIITKSVFCHLTDGLVEMEGGAAMQAKYPGKYFNMGPDPRLPPMPEKPRCSTTSATASPPPTISCKAAHLRSRPATAKRWCWPACCTISRW